MQNNTTIIPFLKVFDRREMNQLEGFIKFKKPNRPKVLDFFKYLKKYYPKFPENKIEKEAIAKKLYPGDPKIRHVNNRMTDLAPIIKDFIIELQSQKEENTREFLYLNWLKNKRDLMSVFFDKAERLENKWNEKERQGIEFLYCIYQLKRLVFTHPGFLKQNKFSTEPKAILNLFEKYFFINKMYWLLILYFNTQHVKGKKKIEIEVALEQILNLENRLPDSSFKLLQDIVKVIIQDSNQDNQGLFNADRLEEAYIFFTDHEITDVVSFLTQIGYKDYQKGKPNSLENLFAINKFSIEKGTIVQDDTLSSDTFHNIINIACAVGELDWVEQFIEETGKYLSKEEQKSGITLGKAGRNS